MTPDAESPVNALADRFWEGVLETSPTLASFYGDDRWAGELEDTTAYGRAVVRALMERSVRRLEMLCGNLLHRSYPRLARAPLNLETNDLLANAARKLESKHLDLIVGNNVAEPDAGFEVDTNRAVILDTAGGVEPLPLQSKIELAEVILDRVHDLLNAKDAK